MSIEVKPKLVIYNFYEQEVWLANHRDAISAAIDSGMQAADRGELIAGHQLQANMKTRKQEWLDLQ